VEVEEKATLQGKKESEPLYGGLDNVIGNRKGKEKDHEMKPGTWGGSGKKKSTKEP